MNQAQRQAVRRWMGQLEAWVWEDGKVLRDNPDNESVKERIANYERQIAELKEGL